MMLQRIVFATLLVFLVLLCNATPALTTLSETSSQYTNTLPELQSDHPGSSRLAAANVASNANSNTHLQSTIAMGGKLDAARFIVGDQSALLVMGLLLGLAVLSLFISIALKLRQAAAVLGICLCLVFLVLHIYTHQLATFRDMDVTVAMCILLLTIFAADVSRSLESAKNAPTLGSYAIRVYQAAMIAIALAVVLFPLALIAQWSMILVLTCAAGFVGFSFYAGYRLINGKNLAIFMLVAWSTIAIVLVRMLIDRNNAFDTVFNWAVVIPPLVLAFGFSYNSLSYRIRWLSNLEETERTGELLNIERSHRGFSREVENFISNLDPNAYEEAILGSFLSHLDNVVPVAASAVVISHRGTLRLVTRFKHGNAENFTTVLESREQLLESVCLADQAAVIHSDELGLNASADSISTLCIVPLSLEREDWCGVVLVRSFDRGFHLDEIRLVKDFSEHAQNALTNAISFGKVRRQAEIDSLTDMFNRGAIMARAEHAFKKFRSLGTNFSVLFIDIDKFKKINDNYGHVIGDKALKQVAQICHSCLRENDKVGRYGGEEFIVLLPNADAKNAQNVAERIRASVESTPLIVNDEAVYLTVSIGISEIADRFIDFNGMLRAADRALYCAKREGRNRVVHHLYMLRGDKIKIGFK